VTFAWLMGRSSGSGELFSLTSSMYLKSGSKKHLGGGPIIKVWD